MARFLFVVPPLAGHVNPTIAVGQTLIDAQHEVAWVGCESVLSSLLPKGFTIIPVDETEIRKVYQNWFTKSQTVFGLDSFKFFFEDFMIPLGHFMYPSVLKAIHNFKPDLLICDQQAIAGGVAARKCSVPWITLATTPAAVFNPLEQFPKVKEWMAQKLGEFQDHYQLARWPRPDISPNGVIIFSLEILVKALGNLEQAEQQTDLKVDIQGDIQAEIQKELQTDSQTKLRLGAKTPYYFVGPSIRNNYVPPEFPWERLEKNKPKVYITLGTLNAERSLKFYEKVKQAFTDKDIQIILSAPPYMLGEVPPNFIVQKNIPQLELLKKVDAVIFHGGHNTFCESLFNGLPLVVAPIKDDQPVIAAQVVQSGVGLRIHFDRVKSNELYQVTQRVLTESQFRLAAENIQKAFLNSGGAVEAAAIISAVGSRPPSQYGGIESSL